MAESSFVHLVVRNMDLAATQVEFDDSILDSESPQKFEPSKHIDLHMWCHF